MLAFAAAQNFKINPGFKAWVSTCLLIHFSAAFNLLFVFE
jgi:hypothetical protein